MKKLSFLILLILFICLSCKHSKKSNPQKFSHIKALNVPNCDIETYNDLFKTKIDTLKTESLNRLNKLENALEKNDEESVNYKSNLRAEYHSIGQITDEIYFYQSLYNMLITSKAHYNRDILTFNELLDELSNSSDPISATFRRADPSVYDIDFPSYEDQTKYEAIIFSPRPEKFFFVPKYLFNSKVGEIDAQIRSNSDQLNIIFMSYPELMLFAPEFDVDGLQNMTQQDFDLLVIEVIKRSKQTLESLSENDVEKLSEKSLPITLEVLTEFNETNPLCAQAIKDEIQRREKQERIITTVATIAGTSLFLVGGAATLGSGFAIAPAFLAIIGPAITGVAGGVFVFHGILQLRSAAQLRPIIDLSEVAEILYGSDGDTELTGKQERHLRFAQAQLLVSGLSSIASGSTMIWGSVTRISQIHARQIDEALALERAALEKAKQLKLQSDTAYLEPWTSSIDDFAANLARAMQRNLAKFKQSMVGWGQIDYTRPFQGAYQRNPLYISRQGPEITTLNEAGLWSIKGTTSSSHGGAGTGKMLGELVEFVVKNPDDIKKLQDFFSLRPSPINFGYVPCWHDPNSCASFFLNTNDGLALFDDIVDLLIIK